jgi:hypothetical protein
MHLETPRERVKSCDTLGYKLAITFSEGLVLSSRINSIEKTKKLLKNEERNRILVTCFYVLKRYDGMLIRWFHFFH